MKNRTTVRPALQAVGLGDQLRYRMIGGFAALAVVHRLVNQRRQAGDRRRNHVDARAQRRDIFGRAGTSRIGPAAPRRRGDVTRGAACTDDGGAIDWCCWPRLGLALGLAEPAGYAVAEAHRASRRNRLAAPCRRVRRSWRCCWSARLYLRAIGGRGLRDGAIRERVNPALLNIDSHCRPK